MFTGIVEAAGLVTSLCEEAGGARLSVSAPEMAASVRVGDSVAVNGVCLTAVDVSDGGFAFVAIPETMSRTNLGRLKAGDRVNLERPLAAGGRLDGHIVQGHVDGVARILSLRPEGNSHRIRLELPGQLRPYVVLKGSLALDGISLTVAAAADDWVEVAIIPHTWEVTNLSGRSVGDELNIEVDVIARYVERLLGNAAVGRVAT